MLSETFPFDFARDLIAYANVLNNTLSHAVSTATGACRVFNVESSRFTLLRRARFPLAGLCTGAIMHARLERRVLAVVF